MKVFMISFCVLAMCLFVGCASPEVASAPSAAPAAPAATRSVAVAPPSQQTRTTIWVEEQRRNPDENKVSAEYR